MIRPGQLRTPVTIQTSTETRDNVGEADVTWSTVASRYAHVEQASGSEVLRGRQVAAVVTSVVTIRYTPNVRPKMRLLLEDRALDIASVADPTGRRELMRLDCTEVQGLPAETVAAAAVAEPEPEPDAYDTSGAVDPDVCFAYEDWTTYADTAALQAHLGTSNDVGCKYWQTVNKTFATIDPTVTLAGHHTLKHTLPGGGSAATFQPQVVFRNALNGGDGTTTPLFSKLWCRYRWRFTNGFEIEGKGPGFPLSSSPSYKAAAFGWFGGTSGHASGRSTHEFHGAGAGLKIGLGATGGALNFTDIATTDQETGAAGALFTDEQWRDMVGLFEYTGAYTFRLRWWKAITGFVPTKIVDITGTVDIELGHESDPLIPDPDLPGHENHVIVRPYFDRFYLGLNYNRERDIARSLHWGSLEFSDGTLHANAFALPAAELV